MILLLIFLKITIFLKNIDYDLKTALISESDLFLMPSRIENKSVEGFGISFLEAASYGVASIGGKDGGASDAILNNKTGLICDGNDLNSIYEAVIDFFTNDKFNDFTLFVIVTASIFFASSISPGPGAIAISILECFILIILIKSLKYGHFL